MSYQPPKQGPLALLVCPGHDLGADPDDHDWVEDRDDLSLFCWNEQASSQGEWF